MNIQGVTPSTIAAVQTPVANAASASTATNSSSSNTITGESATSLQDTFMNLLVTELQNQDPTAPVDPTEMVG
jgi:flagellar basal-body rod modification protein FlgD